MLIEVRRVPEGEVRALWKDARRSDLFPSRRLFLDFFKELEGKAYLAPGGPREGWALLGKWRGGSDLHCLWFIHYRGEGFGELLRAVLEEYLTVGGQLITRMMEEGEAGAFRRAGFCPFEEIAVLEGDASSVRLPERPPGLRMRRFRPGEIGELLQVDSAAFDPLWRLDAWSFRCVSRYCRYNRVIVAEDEGRMAGYCIAGTNGYLGFIQRLGVCPSCQGRGWGSALLREQVAWMGSLGTRLFVVNTQRENLRALRAYRQAGFVREAAPRYIYRYVR